MRGYWPPPIWVPAEWPAKKWLGRYGGVWMGLTGLGFFLFLMLVGGLVLQNGAAVTVGLLVGSVTVAASFLYTLAYRLVPRDTLTLSRLLVAFGLGGLVAVTIGSSFDSLLAKVSGGSGSTPGTVVLLLAGISEELAKILAVVLVSRGLREKSPRNGLFLGAAVGFGFAALEDLSYAVNFYVHPPAQYHLGHLGAALLIVPVRALETPFLHPMFTALFAAVLFRASRNGRFRITWRVVLAYLGVALLHGLFDGGPTLLQRFLPVIVAGILTLVLYAGIVVVPGLIWLRVARRARWDFQYPIAWWLAPPPFAQPPVWAPFAQPAVHPPLALPALHPPFVGDVWRGGAPVPPPLQQAWPVAPGPQSAWPTPSESMPEPWPTSPVDDPWRAWPPPAADTIEPEDGPGQHRVGRHSG
jgi:protease PrsW